MASSPPMRNLKGQKSFTQPMSTRFRPFPLPQNACPPYYTSSLHEKCNLPLLPSDDRYPFSPLLRLSHPKMMLSLHTNLVHFPPKRMPHSPSYVLLGPLAHHRSKLLKIDFTVLHTHARTTSQPTSPPTSLTTLTPPRMFTRTQTREALEILSGYQFQGFLTALGMMLFSLRMHSTFRTLNMSCPTTVPDNEIS